MVLCVFKIVNNKHLPFYLQQDLFKYYTVSLWRRTGLLFVRPDKIYAWQDRQIGLDLSFT